VYEAARAAGGRVNVTGAPGQGARFQVWLPAERPPARVPILPVPVDPERQQLDLDDLRPGGDADDPAHKTRSTIDRHDRESPEQKRGELLVVEDNADLREYLMELLSPDWSVSTAAGGDEGYAAAARHLPDLIISDLMMPAGDGFDLLARLRDDPDTCHIPVLFLTARQDSRTRLRAYALKADAFLSKPFDAEELRARLEQMLSQRERLQAWLRGRGATEEAPEEHESSADADRRRESGPSETAPPDLSPRDRQLLERIDEWMWKHYADPDTEVSQMAEALHLTSRTLQRKLKALEGRTPAARLRDFRLERARGLLRVTERSVTDISLACGFSSSQYFSRVFRQETGMAPSAWRDHAGAESGRD
ncbi:MAG: response regulator, partial [Wenzhouxiangellaceae bacterium]